MEEISEVDFMRSALVVWIQTFSVEPVTYYDLCDGSFLYDVIRTIDPRIKPSAEPASPSFAYLDDRFKNWNSLLEAIHSFYQDVLHEHVVAPLPNIFQICLQPAAARDELQSTLLLLLGCAVRCDRKQTYIEKIKSLDIQAQEAIVEFIKQATDPSIAVLSKDIEIELQDETSRLLYRHVTQLLQQRRSAILSTQQMLSIVASQCSCHKQTSTISQSETVNDSKTDGTAKVISRDQQTQIRVLRQMLDERNADIAEISDELAHVKQSLNKLKMENSQLIQESRAARVYRDELDIAREKAARADKYETEITKLREKLGELDFVKARLDELRSENHLLIEAKLDLEDQLAQNGHEMAVVVELEKELNQYKLLLEQASMELETERRKTSDLCEQKTRLEVLQEDTALKVACLEEQLLGKLQPTVSNGGGSISDQMLETTAGKILQLELDNRRLTRQLANIRNCAVTSNKSELTTAGSSNQHTGSVFKSNGHDAYPPHSKHPVFSVRKSPSPDNAVDRLACLLDSSTAEVSAANDEVFAVEKSKLISENQSLQKTIANLQAACEKYSAIESQTLAVRSENRKLSKKVEVLEAASDRVDLLEQDNSRLSAELESTKQIAEKTRGLSETVTELEIEKDRLLRSVQQLQKALDSARIDRVNLDQVERNLATAMLEKEQLRRKLEAVTECADAAQLRCDQLTAENEQLTRSIDSLSRSAEKLEEAWKQIAALERNVDDLQMEKSSLERERGRLQKIADNYRVQNEQLAETVAKSELSAGKMEKYSRNVANIYNDEPEKDVDTKEHSVVWQKKLNSEPGLESYTSKTSFSLQPTPTKCTESIDGYIIEGSPSVTGSVDVALKDRLIALERQNAAMEEERRTLRQRCSNVESNLRSSESHNVQLSSELSATHGQMTALQSRLDRLETVNITASQLETQNLALRQDCERLKAKVSRVSEELREALTAKSELDGRLELVQKTVEKQMSEYNSLSAEYEKVKSSRNTLDFELSETKQQLKIVSAELENLLRLKSERDDRSSMDGEESELQDEISAELLRANVRLESERDQARDELEQLAVELKDAKEDQNRWQRKYEQLHEEFLSNQRQLGLVEIDYNKLLNKCDSLSEWNVKLEEERQMMMKQLQSLMNQVQELLTELINSKDVYAADQKAYLQQLADLRRHKEKLEEKIMEQYKTNTSSRKKNKSFGAVLVRKARNAMNLNRSRDLHSPVPEFSSTTELSLADGASPLHGSGSGISTQSHDNYPKSPSHRSTSSDEVLPSTSHEAVNNARSHGDDNRDDLSTNSRSGTLRAVGFSCGYSIDPDEETISLDQFLTECNRSPESRRRLLADKNVSMDDVSTASSRKQSHWSSIVALFNPSSSGASSRSTRPASAMSTTSLSRSRKFRSEMNISASPAEKQQWESSRDDQMMMCDPKGRPSRQRSALDRPTLVTVEMPLFEEIHLDTFPTATAGITSKPDFSGAEQLSSPEKNRVVDSASPELLAGELPDGNGSFSRARNYSRRRGSLASSSFCRSTSRSVSTSSGSSSMAPAGSIGHQHTASDICTTSRTSSDAGISPRTSPGDETSRSEAVATAPSRPARRRLPPVGGNTDVVLAEIKAEDDKTLLEVANNNNYRESNVCI